MNGARTTGCDTAAELGAGQSDDIADCPEERHIGRDVEDVLRAVDIQAYHGLRVRRRGYRTLRRAIMPEKISAEERLSATIMPSCTNERPYG